MFHSILLLTRWLLVVFFIGGLSFPAGATVCNVTNTTDNELNSGSLRYSIESGTCDEINIATSGTISLTTNEFIITNSLIIHGNGLIIDGQGALRVFEINSGITVTLSDLTIKNGNAAYGAGIYNNGNLTLNGCTLENNESTDDFWGGGAIKNHGILHVENSTISNNTATINGGGIANYGTADLVHVTLVENNVTDVATGKGGGIYNAGSLTITNSIISGNTLPADSPEVSAEIYHDGTTFTATGMNVLGLNDGWGTNIAETELENCLKPDAGSAIGNIVNDLADNGGPTQTRAPVFGGLAWNAGDNTSADGLEYDQRGGWRILDGTVDIGAVEVGTVPLNDTGITSCSNTTQNGLVCPVTGFPFQDAEFGSNGFNFTKLDADGNDLPATATDHTCTRDNVTGLIWEVKTDSGLRDQNSTYTWYDSTSTDGNLGTANGGVCNSAGHCDTEKFVADVNAAGLCGYHDWRMPTVKELTGITDLGRYSPAIDSDYFPNTPSSWFWSGSPSANNSGSAWHVYFVNGGADNYYRDYGFHVRLVRGGQSFDSFVDNADGTVTQSNTGLMWAKCSEGQTGVGCTGTATTMTWSEALTAANSSSLGGYINWRLPNAKELQALVDYSLYNPTISSSYFPNTVSSWFWSGSPDAYYSDSAWVVIFDYGDANGYSRGNGFHVRLVRGGQPFTTYDLTVTNSGTGTGSVISSDGFKINCGTTCFARLNTGTSVTLTAAADSDSVFMGWSGGGCLGTGTCTVTMSDAKNITATFNLIPQMLTVINSRGNGTITSNPAGISCSSGTCISSYVGTVTLTATPNSGYQFAGWSGACSDANVICNVPMTAAQDVTANFTPLATGTGSDWQVISSSGNDLKAVIYGNGLFVAVGDSGNIRTSPDGLTWTVQTSSTTNNLWGVTWSGSKFVAVGNSGTILTSSNGTSWTPQTSNTTSTLLNVTWSGSRFVVVGDAILTSSDGVTWTTRTSGTANTLYGVTWSGTQFVAVGGAGTILTSTDGVTWSSQTSGTTNYLWGVTWNGSLFVATGYSGTILTSSNGTSWTPQTSRTTNYLWGITWNGSLFVVVGDNSTIRTSPDGVNWTPRSSGITNYLHSVTWNGSRFVAVGANGTILISPPNSFTLTVNKNGTGTSTITSDVGGINCGTTCNANINNGTLVTLTAAPTSGIAFAGWSGNCSGMNNTCTITMDAAKAVTATFNSVTSISVNDTGITSCSNVNTNGLPCPVTGFPRQDAEYGSNGFNFTKISNSGAALPFSASLGSGANDWACMRDNTTGLIWEVKTDNSTPDLRDKDWTYTWYDISAGGTTNTTTNCHGSSYCNTAKYVNDVNFTVLCGFNDWRMPTAKELVGIVDYGRSVLAIDPNYFPNTDSLASDWYWSGSTYANNASKAWYVDFGNNGNSFGDTRTTAHPVRLVRGNQSLNAFVDNGNGTITQSNTGLMWAKCAVGLSGTGCTGTVLENATWSDALTAANTSILGGYSDWRLPTIKELQSLMDYTRSNPAIDNTTYFPNTNPSAWLWSSSPVSGDVNKAWYIHPYDSSVDTLVRTTNFNTRVRLVRSGTGQYYDLTVSKSGAGTGIITSDFGGINCGFTCATRLAVNTNVTLTATADTGAIFTGWSGDCSGTGNCIVTTNATKNVTANFAVSRAVNITIAGSGTVTANYTVVGTDCTTNCSLSYPDAAAVALNATPATGYSFTGWGTDCTGTGVCSLTMNANKTVTANFTANSYSITATANPTVGGSVSCSPNPITSGGAANCTATANSGYTFANFSGDCSGTTCALTNVTANKTVTANFTGTYSITATANPIAGGSISCSPNPVTSGNTANCTATPNTGYTFANFSGDCTGSTCVLTNVTANKTVTANFTATYSITATANPTVGGSISCSPNPVASGADANCTAMPNAGYALSNFSGDCGGATCSLTNVTAAKAVTAHFIPLYSITVTANPTAGGSISCSPNPVASGADANCTAMPNAGYALSNFSGDCGGATCVLNNVTAAKAVTANFTPLYSITATANPIAGGSISCSPNPVASSADANCTAMPNAGYALSNFSGDCGGTTCVLTNVTADKTVTANFTATYSITATANPSAGGSISCLPNPVASGADANCTATPNTGYALSNFSGDCSDTTCVLTNVTANKTVTANFIANTYSITATANPTAGGTVNCLPNQVTFGNTANCTATANDGYTFNGFGGDCTGSTCALTSVTANKTVTANFTANSYLITATANPIAGGTVNCSPNPVTSGNTANCTATANAGYTFTNFSGDCSGATCALTNVTTNKNVTANFAAVTYSIIATANPTGGGSISCLPNPVASGADANCTAMPNAGYALSNFSGDCSGATCALTNVTANKTVSANFTANTYSITATANPSAGGSVSCLPSSVAYNGTANCTATPNTGYTLANFSGDCSGATCALTNVTANKTVSANFTANTYSITATVNPTVGGSVNCSPNPVTFGDTANCTAIANAGYTFNGFGGDCSGITCALTNVTANKNVTANFTAVTYSITTTANPIAGGLISCSPNPVASGADANCTATSNAGYTFANFSGDCSGATCVLTNVTADKTVTANFTAVTYSITATANPIAGGSISCLPNPVASGADANCTAMPNAGYALSNFSGDCSGTTCALTNVTANKTVSANFTANTYSITATANPIAGGLISCSPNPIASGATANCTATANTGYALSNFSGDCSGATCVLNNVTANKIVTANFAANSYSITATANPTMGGTVTCSPNPVTTGNTANCTATANAGYTFNSFSGDCTGSTCVLTNVTANKNVTANFRAITYSITTTANPIAGGSISCSPNPVTSGNTANCTATPNTGYTFANFSGDCTGSTCVLTNVTANKTVTANFTATYSITATANPTAGGSISCSPNPVASGADANCTATPNAGYALSNFSGDCSGTTCVLTHVTAAKAVTANFTPLYSITATANPIAGGSISCLPNPVASGADANCTATPNAGYAFVDFSGDCNGVTCVLTNVTANKNVTANFTAVTYSITATANPSAGGSISCLPNPVASGADANCTATPNTGYALSNFSGDCTGSTCVLTNVTANKTVTANFTATYSITTTANPIAGGLISCSPNPVASGADANCTATPNAGYALSNFSGDCSGTTCSFTNVIANKTVTANFTLNTYSITATANPTVGGSVSCSPNPVTSDDTANCTATPNAGYTFTNFSDDCSGTTCAFSNVTANKTVTANFTAISTYSITATANPSAGGTVNCSPNPVTSDDTANCTATPNAGYTFTNFSDDCSGTTCAFSNVTANKTVTANFTVSPPTVKTYKLLIDKTGSGTITSDVLGINCGSNCMASFNEGTAVTLTATPAAGETFIRWSNCDLVNAAKQCVVTLVRTKLISATFTANVAPIADFVITDITLSPPQPNAGSAFNAAITVKNQGTSGMNGGTLSVWGDLPTGKNCGATSTVKTAIGVLAANETKTFTVSLPPMTRGNKRLRVFADSTCGTYEANERNNQSFLDYRVE